MRIEPGNHISKDLPFPHVSIGLPVYNGEKYLQAALDSILTQSYTDFELLISDNGSTDRTQEICLTYQAADRRIRYCRSDQNRGAAWNFNRLVDLAAGEYFKWVAHDDLVHPAFLEKAVKVLDSDPSVVVVSAGVVVIGEDGKRIEDYDVRLNTDSPDPKTRFYDLLIRWHLCFDVFGLIRTDALRRTPVIGNFAHGDGILLEWLAFQGRIVQLPELMLYARKHLDQSMKVYGVFNGKDPDYHQYTLWFDPSKQGKVILPTWRILWEHGRSVWQAQLNAVDRLACLLFIGRWMIRRRRPLFYDLRIAAGQGLRRRSTSRTMQKV